MRIAGFYDPSTDRCLPPLFVKPAIQPNEPKKYALMMEFSLPNLLFGNNYYEVEESDLEDLITRIQRALLVQSGITFSRDEIKNAQVIRIDYGKNIVSKTPGFQIDVMDALASQYISKRQDVIKTEYANDGHGFRIHTKKREILFYDKNKDLQKEGISKSRSFLDDLTIKRKELSKQLEDNGLCVGRLEIRLNGVKAIRKGLDEIGEGDRPLTLKSLFNLDLSKKILNHEWQKYTAGMSVSELDEGIEADFANSLKYGNKPLRALEQIGLQTILKEVDVTKFRAIIEAHGYKQSWRTIKPLMGEIPKERSHSIGIVDKQLEDFIMIRPP